MALGWKVIPASGYALAHRRIRTDIKTGSCSEPGCKRSDTEIALIHGRGQYADSTGVHAGMRYSIDANDYIELCRSHHRQYDLEVEGGAAQQLVRARSSVPDAQCERCGRTFKATGLPRHLEACGRSKPPCTETGCPNPAKSRGFCSTHYERWRKHGNPQTVAVSTGQFKAGHIPHNKT